jgi:thiol-disulfide isomerase/thioredoxin
MRNVFLLLFFSVYVQAQTNVVGVSTEAGKLFSFAQCSKNKATIFLFVSPECPLCQGYSLTMRNLDKQFSSKGIKFYAIVAGTFYTQQEVLNYKKQYQVPFEILYDKKNNLVKYFKATITPEVFVTNEVNKIIYSGRIDNWAYAPGKKRTIVTEHDLETALQAIVLHKPISVSKTKAIGCFIE